MTGAELKVLLQGIGIPPSWFAAHCNVTMRTVVRWFDGKDVAPKVESKALALYDESTREVAGLYRKAMNSAPDPVLYTYRTDDEFDGDLPASWHRAITFRVVEMLRNNGVDSTVEYR